MRSPLDPIILKTLGHLMQVTQRSSPYRFGFPCTVVVQGKRRCVNFIGSPRGLRLTDSNGNHPKDTTNL